MRCDPDAVVRSMRWLRMITVAVVSRMVGAALGRRWLGPLPFFHAPRCSSHQQTLGAPTAVELDSKFELDPAATHARQQKHNTQGTMSDELTLELSSSEEELGLGLGLGGGMLGGLPTWREARMRESSPSPEKRLRLWNASTSRRDLLPWPRAFSPSRRA